LQEHPSTNKVSRRSVGQVGGCVDLVWNNPLTQTLQSLIRTLHVLKYTLKKGANKLY